jgi:TusA-related sulfurtransferase
MAKSVNVNGLVLDFDVSLDVKGLACPMPLLKAKLALKSMENGQVLLVQSTDSGSWRDIPAFLNLASHELIAAEQQKNVFVFLIKK